MMLICINSFLESCSSAICTVLNIFQESATCTIFPSSVENENHCDFVKLREMLICTNMEDLREQTHMRHYELYRRCKLEEMGFRDTGPENKPVR